jgi:hypothetical protein
LVSCLKILRKSLFYMVGAMMLTYKSTVSKSVSKLISKRLAKKYKTLLKKWGLALKYR